MNLSKKLRIDEIVGNKNIADLLEKGDLEQIGAEVLRGFEQDIQSRSEWEARSAGAIAMALQVREAKNFPWINASNVKFPLITIAALQFLARIFGLFVVGRVLRLCGVRVVHRIGKTRGHYARCQGLAFVAAQSF